MITRLFITNFPYSLDEKTLSAAISSYAVQARDVRLVRDKETNQSRGFGFFDVEGDGAAEITLLNGQDFAGRSVKVERAAKQPGDAPPRGGNRRPAAGPWHDDEDDRRQRGRR